MAGHVYDGDGRLRPARWWKATDGGQGMDDQYTLRRTPDRLERGDFDADAIVGVPAGLLWRLAWSSRHSAEHTGDEKTAGQRNADCQRALDLVDEMAAAHPHSDDRVRWAQVIRENPGYPAVVVTEGAKAFHVELNGCPDVDALVAALNTPQAREAWERHRTAEDPFA